MSEKKFKFIMPAEFTKSDDGEWRIKGLASTASRDQQGEIMLQDGMDLTPIEKKKGIINWDHKKGPENTLGVLDGYTKTPEGLYIEGRLFKNHDKAKAAYQIMSSLGKSDYGRMGLSVEGSIKERAGKNGEIIKRSVITGVALTMNPVNSDTYVDLTKSMTQTDIEFNASDAPIGASDTGSETDLASSESQSPTFTSDQVLDIVRKALAVGGEYASTTPSERSGGAALAQEDLDKNCRNVQKADDQIEGGLADDKKPSDFDKKALEAGIKVEMEHTKDAKIAKEIAMDHLTEDAKYYEKLATIEKGSVEWFQKSITDAVDSLRMLYPGIPTEILLKALEDRLNTKYGVKPSN